MTIESRETRFITPFDVAPGEIEDIESTRPHGRRQGAEPRSARRRPMAFTPASDIDPFAVRILSEPPTTTAVNPTRTATEPILPQPAAARVAEPASTTIDAPTIDLPKRTTPKTAAPEAATLPAPRRDPRADGAARAVRPATSPRVTEALERRRLWERRYRDRLRATDVAVIAVATLLPRGVDLLLTQGAALAGNVIGIVTAFATPLLVAAVWFTMLSVFRTRETAIVGSGSTEYLRVLNATAFGFGALAMIFVVLGATGLRDELLVALPLGTLLLLAGRWGWRRWLLRERAYGHYVSRTFIVGDRADVQYVIETLHRDGQRGYLVVGATLTDGDMGELRVDGQNYPVLGSPRSAARTAARLGADTIIVASHDDADPYFVKRLSWQLEGTAAELVLSSRLTDVAGPRISLRLVDGLPLIQVKIPSFDGAQYALKRTLDIVVSTLALAAIAIVAVPLALLIKLDSRGPVFFRQERVGRDGHRFHMVKFRTMRVGAEAELAALAVENEGAGPLFKMHNDPRVTRVGAILRKLSLDELPQFWNVLRGDMSVVGPRPPLPSEVTAYNGTVYRRLYIKPGITGLWQVSGRSDLPWDESVRLDLRYVENWSIMSDLTIMWRTAQTMLAPKGAY